MKKRLGVLLLLCGLLATFAGLAAIAETADPTELLFVNVQSGEDDALKFQPILDSLEASLGIPVKYVVATDYAAVLQAMLYGHAEMARVGPFQFIQAEQLFEAIPLVCDIKTNTHLPCDYTLILARPDLGIEPEAATADQLRGLKIAYVDPTSTSGYLVPKITLKNMGIEDEDFAQIYFAGSHDATIIALANGAVNLACCNDFRLGKNLAAGNIHEDEYVIAVRSVPIPTNPVIVCPGFSEEFMARLTEAWLAVPAEACAIFGLDGFAPVTADEFGMIRLIADEFDLNPGG